VLRYASYCYDSESALYYLSARSYDPKTRQFLSKDLSRNDGEQSAYQYCFGNPVKYVDPSGLYTMTPYLAALFKAYSKYDTAEIWDKAIKKVEKSGRKVDSAFKKTVKDTKARIERRKNDPATFLGSTAPAAPGARIGLDGYDPVYMTGQDWRDFGYHGFAILGAVSSGAGAALLASGVGAPFSLVAFSIAAGSAVGQHQCRPSEYTDEAARASMGESAYMQALSMAIPQGSLPGALVLGGLGIVFLLR
jgi:RHS repeat-associated protein